MGSSVHNDHLSPASANAGADNPHLADQTSAASFASSAQTIATPDKGQPGASALPDMKEYSDPVEGDQSSEINSGNSDVEKTAEPQQAPSQPAKDPNLIEFDGPDDPANPQNWTKKRKWLATTILSSVTFCVTFASSVFSTATVVTAEEFGVSDEVMILGTSLFVLGFAVGPLVWGPLSEVFGRKPPMFAGFAIFAIFQIPVAVATNIQSIMLFRFFGGLFACAPLAIIGGMLADIWDPVDRGIAIVTFAGATFVGPVAGPIVGSAIVESHLGWRWTAWITLIMAAFFGLLAFITVPETYPAVILQSRAKKIRFDTKNWAVHSALDEKRVDLQSIMNVYLLRPIRMLFTEAILLLMTLYMALVYGIMYLFFEAYPIAFQIQRGWSPLKGSLPFLSIIVGVLVGGAIIIYFTKTRFARKLKKHGRVVPEERLPPMMIGAVLFPVGLFWFAWTSSPHISPWPQIIAGVSLGAGVLIIFMQGLNYIIDVYLMYANSAIAANTLIRSLLGAGFPMFATAMYNKLGVAWATSLLGFLTVAMVPVPVLFFIYGKKIRSWSKMSANKM